MNEQQQLSNRLLEMITAKWTTYILSAAAELGIADVLRDDRRSAAQIAEELGTIPSITHRILRALVTLGVVDESEEHTFGLTPLGNLLRTDTPGTMHSLVRMLGKPWHNRTWEQLSTCARKGGSGGEHAFGMHVYEYLDKKQEDFDNFHAAMRDGSTAIHVTASEAYDFSGISTLVDIGGATGRLLGTVLAKHPHMRGILFDRPSVEAAAQVELDKLGVAERCAFIGGDFFASVPAGGDAYMMTHVIRNWDDAEAVVLLKNCRQVMPKGGKLLALDTLIEAKSTRDWDRLMDLEMLVCLGGRARTVEDFSRLFAAAGFKLSRITPTRSMITIVEGVPV